MSIICMRMTMRLCSAMNEAYIATDYQIGGKTHSDLICLYPSNLHPHLYFFSSVCSRTFSVTSTCFCSFFKVSLDDHGHLVHFDHTKTLNLIMLYLISYSNVCEFAHLLTEFPDAIVYYHVFVLHYSKDTLEGADFSWLTYTKGIDTAVALFHSSSMSSYSTREPKPLNASR